MESGAGISGQVEVFGIVHVTNGGQIIFSNIQFDISIIKLTSKNQCKILLEFIFI